MKSNHLCTTFDKMAAKLILHSFKSLSNSWCRADLRGNPLICAKILNVWLNSAFKLNGEIKWPFTWITEMYMISSYFHHLHWRCIIPACLHCDFSFSEDDVDGNLPRVLLCGHIYCTSCLLSIQCDSVIRCPECEVKLPLIPLLLLQIESGITQVLTKAGSRSVGLVNSGLFPVPQNLEKNWPIRDFWDRWRYDY